MSNRKKNNFDIGKVTYSDSGQQFINIGGQNYDYKNVPTGKNYAAGNKVLLFNNPDGTVTVIGRSGYSTSALDPPS